VSGVGDDVNPCSRTAPCKTFAGAISKTAAKGEIDVLDSAGFGAVTINKAITINASPHLGGVLVISTNAIIISAAATDRVSLIGLDINGVGTGINGVRILQAKNVRIVRTDIYGFKDNGVSFEPSNADARLVVVDSTIHDNGGNGILVGPRGKATVRGNDIEDNRGCGIIATSFPLGSISASTPDYSQNCGVAVGGTQVGPISVGASHNRITDSGGAAVESIGDNAVTRIASNDIFNNAVGMKVVLGGSILSYGNNHVGGNDVDGNPTGRVQTR
jgi:hypothetical protein